MTDDHRMSSATMRGVFNLPLARRGWVARFCLGRLLSQITAETLPRGVNGDLCEAQFLSERRGSLQMVS